MKQGLIFWFTGLSGVGKTTLANQARERLKTEGFKVSILDGDDIRNRLNQHLGFSEPDVKENNDLIAGLCESERKLADIVLVPIISPYAESRERARQQLFPGFFNVHLFAKISILEERDTKGFYAKVRNGKMDNLIGYSPSAPYEPPETSDLVIDTGVVSVDEALNQLINFILAQDFQ